MSQRGGERRKAREFALQLLFQLDLSPDDVQDAVERFWEGKTVAEGTQAFTLQLVEGTMAHREALDELLAAHAVHWRISRMPVVDRNILRMALCEFFLDPQTPRIVVIDEAIEIAKKYGNDESGPFINGILDAVRIKLEAGELDLPASLASPPPAAHERSIV